MKIYFATSNAGKVANAAAAMKPFGIEVEQVVLDLAESRSEDPAEIAMEKARQAYAQLKKPVMVEDSGFFINALGGFPMTHIKFSLKTLGIEKIMKMLKGEDRRCEWRMTAAYVAGEKKYKSFTFVEKGEIATKIRPIKRPMMSDYWRIYIPKMIEDNKRALSELTDADLERWNKYYDSHNQFLMLGKWLKKNVK